MRCLIFLISIIIAIEAVTDVNLVNAQWEDFKATYNKEYDTELEESFRKKIFMDNLYKIADHNRKYAKGEVSFQLGINEYSDMLHTEFVRTMNGLKRSNRTTVYQNYDAATYIPPANVELPSFVDWRKQGAVTPIKNQGQCGSCWAFSATGSLEGQHFRKLKKLVSLSEQNLIDCSSKFGNNGCEGGWMDYAFQYVKANRGIDTEKSYPYKAEDEPRCRYNPKTKGATDRGYVDVTTGSEKDLQSAVATVGPISVAIDASSDKFQSYSHGVFYDPECSTTVLDHGVLVVGYGTTKNGQDYWIVKNSWGTSWGDEGYILMARNKDNNCGIATKASYPLV